MRAVEAIRRVGPTSRNTAATRPATDTFTAFARLFTQVETEVSDAE